MEPTALLAKVCETYSAQRAMGGETVEHRLARFVRSPEHPDIYDANHVCAVRARTASKIEELFEACESIYPAEIRHRVFFVPLHNR